MTSCETIWFLLLQLKRNIENVEDDRAKENEISRIKVEQMQVEASQTFEQISSLSNEIENL